jgi:hypothetical protein
MEARISSLTLATTVVDRSRNSFVVIHDADEWAFVFAGCHASKLGLAEGAFHWRDSAGTFLLLSVRNTDRVSIILRSLLIRANLL